MFTEKVEPMTPEIAAAFVAGAREGLMQALNILWHWVECKDAAERRTAEAAYAKLRGMIDAEFPAAADSEAAS